MYAIFLILFSRLYSLFVNNDFQRGARLCVVTPYHGNEVVVLSCRQHKRVNMGNIMHKTGQNQKYSTIIEFPCPVLSANLHL